MPNNCVYVCATHTYWQTNTHRAKVDQVLSISFYSILGTACPNPQRSSLSHSQCWDPTPIEPTSPINWIGSQPQIESRQTPGRLQQTPGMWESPLVQPLHHIKRDLQSITLTHSPTIPVPKDWISKNIFCTSGFPRNINNTLFEAQSGAL